jgi:hypothetical protein
MASRNNTAAGSDEARMKNWKILRDHRRRHTLRDTALGIVNLHNLTITG